MKNFAKIALLTATVSLSSCVIEKKGGSDSLALGASMPEFSLAGGGGNPQGSGSGSGSVSSSDLRGHRTVVVLFRTTCPDCNREMPIVQQAWERATIEDPDLRMVAISKEDPATVAAYWNEAGLTMPYYLDPNGSVFALFDIHYVPTMYLFGTDGKVALAAVETFDFSADELAAKIMALK